MIALRETCVFIKVNGASARGQHQFFSANAFLQTLTFARVFWLDEQRSATRLHPVSGRCGRDAKTVSTVTYIPHPDLSKGSTSHN
jgi:hypothetical protein